MCGQARWGACNGHLGKRSERISGRSAHGSVGFALGRVLGPLMAVEHCLREAGAGGSNPLTPTIKSNSYSTGTRVADSSGNHMATSKC